MASVAEQLRSAREAQNLTINQIAEVTNVRADHIRAIEEGNYDVFSAPVYIRGFVRTYARLLKLDVPQIIAAVDAELELTEKFAAPPSLSGEPRTVVDFITLQLSKIDWRKAAIGIVLLILAGVVLMVWLVMRHQRSSNPLSGVQPAVYQAPSNRTANTLQLPAPAPAPRR